MRIAAFPAFKTKQNPTHIMLYASIQKDNIIVEEFNWKKILSDTYDIIHIHWPESNKLRKTILIAVSYISAFHFLLKTAKLKGAKIVWTVHNMQSHEKKFPLLERMHLKLFTKMVDGVIVMNESTINQVKTKYPSLTNKPFNVIPHGHYKEWYNNDISFTDARSIFNLSVNDKVFLILGQLRPYKGPDNIITYFKYAPHLQYKLLIAGKVSKDTLSYKKTLESLIDNDNRIIFKPGFVHDDELQNYFNAADVIILPYNDMLNSGVLLLALSFNKTVLMPYFESIAELAERFADWIVTYSTLSDAVLEEAITKATANANRKTNMDDLGWNIIAGKTINFYKSLLN